MPIEVTSLTERSSISLRAKRVFRRILHKVRHASRRISVQIITALILISLAVGLSTLIKSYQYYSTLIDARLASGYLTSRPGLYAAPLTIRVGQGYSRDDLVNVLRRAGYVESEASQVWSGSFNKEVEAIEIRPRQTATSDVPEIIRVTFEGKRINGLLGDDLTLEEFTLEPETLTNDLLSKTGKRNALSYSAIPPILVQAILAVEDRRFFDHPGLDFLGITRALWNNAHGDRVGQGGSTITQQLVKNTYLSPERSLRRKYAEAMLAFALERRLSKEDIFALYCNEVYLGQRGAVTVRGVEQAALIYFGKELNQLTLSESATIAGMIQAPARYSPERRTAAAQVRKNIVLAAMANEGWITSEQFYEAAKEPINVVRLADNYHSVAPYFIDYVNNRITDSQIDASGATQQIHTTIDLDLQQLAEESLNRQLERLDKINSNHQIKPQGALVALDPRTGNVLAMVGGREYAVSQLNRATDARRQPGSTFKPFVYAAAIEDGLSPVRMFADVPRDFTYDRNKIYRPANFGGAYSGHEVTMRTGLVQSLNVVTVDVAMQTGLARIANLAARFGLPKPERYPSLALGTTEVTPLQLAVAYSAFVNGGRRVTPRVIAADTNSLEPSIENEQQLISPTTAYMITNMLSAAIDEGTGRAARDAVKGAAIGGKTGTSRDAWFAGYTPNLVCVVWIGFDDNRQLGFTGGSAALPVWKDFVQAAVALKPELGGRTFECPEGIRFVEIDADNGLLSTLSCPHRKLIAITDRLAPNFECYNHSNLPELFDSETENNEVFEKDVVIARRSQSPSDDVIRSWESLGTATRVDVDANGRRTLVNDLR